MNWSLAFALLILHGLYAWLYLYPRLSQLERELNRLTGNKRISKKLISKSIRKSWMKGPIYCYEIAVNSYRHHLSLQTSKERKSVGRKAYNYRPTSHYTPQNRSIRTPKTTSTRQCFKATNNTQPLKQQSRPQTKPPAPKPVPTALTYKLDGLTKDRATSDRLVDGLSYRYPGKSRRWLVEKAISDLERDRRG